MKENVSPSIVGCSKNYKRCRKHMKEFWVLGSAVLYTVLCSLTQSGAKDGFFAKLFSSRISKAVGFYSKRYFLIGLVQKLQGLWSSLAVFGPTLTFVLKTYFTNLTIVWVSTVRLRGSCVTTRNIFVLWRWQLNAIAISIVCGGPECFNFRIFFWLLPASSPCSL